MKLSRHTFFYRKTDALVLAVLLVFVAGGAFLAHSIGGGDDGGVGATDSLVSKGNGEKQRFHRKDTAIRYDQGQPSAARFTFDPNTADSTTLLRLGLSPYLVRAIYKYRAKGGIYRRAEDFGRVPGLTQGQYRELMPYIRISADFLPASDLPETKPRTFHRDTLTFSDKLAAGEHIDLNTADTTLLKRVPGIGSHYAYLVASYRQRLGGFVSIGQLDEIEDFPEKAKAYFVLGDATVKRMNVNRLTLNEMKRHPYMGFYRAKLIVDYRRAHGSLPSLQVLKLNQSFSPKAIQRLEPYVEY